MESKISRVQYFLCLNILNECLVENNHIVVKALFNVILKVFLVIR